MKNSNSTVHEASLGFTGVILLSVAVCAGSARADTFQHGGSTTTIEQSGSGRSGSEVIRYKDGQTIVTKDGNSTDITIQGDGSSPASDYGWGYAEWGDDRFDLQRIEERFSRDAPNERGADDYREFTGSSEREAFKQRMLERMGSRFSP
jgi:hypothetical protein